MLANHPRTRLALYLLALAAQIASFFVAIAAPEIGAAFAQTSDVLAAAALVTAATNLNGGGSDAHT